jgi:diadenylate cyclase
LPIQVDWAGKLPDDLILSDVKLDPEKIRVVGGSQVLEHISTIYTEKVLLDKIRGTGTTQVKLALNPASLKMAPGSDDTVQLTYLVKKKSQ